MYRTLAITISPEYRKGRQDYHYRDDLDKIKLLKSCSKRYMIYPEFSVSGRLHYHGIVEIHDRVKWFKKLKPLFEKMGMLHIKSIDDHKARIGWIIYMSKAWPETKSILSLENPIMPKHEPRVKRHIGYNELDDNIPILKAFTKCQALDQVRAQCAQERKHGEKGSERDSRATSSECFTECVKPLDNYFNRCLEHHEEYFAE